jgi:NAD(P)-dependent dehydrogenase (short-subunit alcohol dehydrogenase family)
MPLPYLLMRETSVRGGVRAGPPYGATKAGVLSFAEALGEEMRALVRRVSRAPRR